MSKADQQTTKRWRKHIQSFQVSGLTREAYCRENDIRVHQLDYWRKKQNRALKGAQEKSPNRFVQLQVHDDAASDSCIALRIGHITVEVKSGFDPKHLESILQVLGATC